MKKEKYVDESWKEQASLEKEVLKESDKKQASSKPPISHQAAESQAEDVAEQTESSGEHLERDEALEVSFLNYITSLGFQTMIFLGEIPNPTSNETEKNLAQAKFLIDTLAMLKEKTAGNLSGQESDLLENTVYELQLRYVQAAKNELPQ